jgi:hypothetical protein
MRPSFVTMAQTLGVDATRFSIAFQNSSAAPAPPHLLVTFTTMFAAYYRAKYGSNGSIKKPATRHDDDDYDDPKSKKKSEIPPSKKRKPSTTEEDVKPAAKKSREAVDAPAVPVDSQGRQLRRSTREAASWKVDYREDSSSEYSEPDDDDDDDVEKLLDMYRPILDKGQVKGEAVPMKTKLAHTPTVIQSSSSSSVARSKQKRVKPPDPDRKGVSIVHKALKHHNASGKSSLPAPGWTLGFTSENDRRQGDRRHTIWISPVRKIAFRSNEHAQIFESYIQKHRGDEFEAWTEYRRLKGKTTAIEPYKYDLSERPSHHPSHQPLLETGWEKVSRTQANGWHRNQWLSPKLKIEFKFTGFAKKFEETRREFHGNEIRAWVAFVQKYGNAKITSSVEGGLRALEKAKEKYPETQAYYDQNEDDLKDYQLPPPPPKKKKKKAKPTLFLKPISSFPNSCNASDSSTLPAPGWTLGTLVDNEATTHKRRSLWISPQRKIPFRKNTNAHMFESFRKQFNGDEFKAWDVYRQEINKLEGSRRATEVINPHQYDTSHTKRFARHDPLFAAGWERKMIPLKQPGVRFHWFSPRSKIEFRYSMVAQDFEATRQAFGGDDEKAWDCFSKKFTPEKLYMGVVGGKNGLKRAKERFEGSNDNDWSRTASV